MYFAYSMQDYRTKFNVNIRKFDEIYWKQLSTVRINTYIALTWLRNQNEFTAYNLATTTPHSPIRGG